MIAAVLKTYLRDNEGVLYCSSVSKIKENSPRDLLMRAQDKMRTYKTIKKIRLCYDLDGMRYEVKIERIEM